MNCIKWRLPYFRKLVAVIFFSTVVVGIVVTMVLYSYFSNTMTREIQRVNLAMLTQTRNQVHLVYDQVTSLGLDLLTDGDMMMFMLSSEADPILEASLMRKLNTSYISSANIDSIIVYNGNRDRYLNSRGIQYPPEQDIVDMINDAENDSVYARVTQIIPRVYTETDMYGVSRNIEHRVLTYIVYPSLKQLSPARYAIAINVRADYMMESVMDSMEMLSGDAAILDASGRTLVSSGLGGFGDNLAGSSYVNTILMNAETRGNFFDRVEGRDSLITYLKEEDREGWVYLNIVPTSLLYPGLTQLRNLTLLVISVMFVIASVMAHLLTRRLYQPIERLMNNIVSEDAPMQAGDEFTRIETSYFDTRYQMRKMSAFLEHSSMRTCLHALFIGEDLNNPLYQSVLDELSGKKRDFRVVIMELLGAGTGAENDIENAIRALEAFLIQRLEESCRVYAHRVDSRRSSLLLCLDAPIDEQMIHGFLAEADEMLWTYFTMRCIFGVGDTVSVLDEIHESHAHAETALMYRYNMEDRRVYDFGALQYLELAVYSYPVQAEKRLIEAMHVGDSGVVYETLDELAALMRSVSYQTARLIVSQIAIALLKEYQHIEDRVSLKNNVLEIGSAQTLSEAIGQLKRIAGDILRALETRRTSRKVDLVNKVIVHMEENMSMSDYDMNLAATALNMSASYLSRRFKAESGVSFRAYLLSLRMKRAESLLRETNLPISEISTSIGIPNTNYFYLLFKRTYGMTPSDFRRNTGK